MASSDETAGSGKRRREDDDEAANPDAALALLRSLRATSLRPLAVRSARGKRAMA